MVVKKLAKNAAAEKKVSVFSFVVADCILCDTLYTSQYCLQLSVGRTTVSYACVGRCNSRVLSGMPAM